MRIHLNRLEEWPEAERLRKDLRRAASAALATAERPPHGELSVTFLPEEEIRFLNRTYTGQDRSTDVLAFEIGPAGEVLGDVYVAPDVARSSAAELGISMGEELLRLVIHGVLHVMGHDHPEGQDRYKSPMFALQEELLQQIQAEGQREEE